MYKLFFKRPLDILISVLAFLLFLPLGLLISILILASMGRPIFFVQRRPGLNGQIFNLIKFRTMNVPSNHQESDLKRVTALGKFLRSTGLDEIPEFINVIKGEMSIIGPRPLLEEYLEKYTLFQKRRHDLRPGITGLAQVSGRNNLDWKNKFRYDVQYVRSVSFKMDFYILVKTFKTVILRENFKITGEDKFK